jgi:hypothetical protein
MANNSEFLNDSTPEAFRAGEDFVLVGAVTAIEGNIATITIPMGPVKVRFGGEDSYKTLSNRAFETAIFVVYITDDGDQPKGDLQKVIFGAKPTEAVN